MAPFAELLTHRSTAGVPVVVETPSADDGHAKDIALLASLRCADEDDAAA